jgi:DNA ligase-1
MYGSNQVTRAFDVLEQLEKTSGRNDKIALLEAAKDNGALKKILFWAYSGDKYYVHLDASEVHTVMSPEGDALQEKILEKFSALLDRLKAREVTGGAAEQEVKSFFLCCDLREGKWYHRVMSHDLRIGCTKSTITKVFGKEFWGSSATQNNSYGFLGVMLADKWEKHRSKYMFKRYYMEPKEDGYRLKAMVVDGKVTFYSRQGKSEPYTTNLTHVADQILDRGFDDCIVDGEILKDSWNGTGVVKKKKMNDEDRANLANISFIAFDYIDLNQVDGEIYRVPFKQRRAQLEGFLAGKEGENLKLIESVLVASEEEAMDLHAKHRKAGKEGSIAKDEDGWYLFNDRSHFWAKIKPVHTIDGKIIGYEPGTGRNEGKVGALVVEDAEGKRYKCGQGMTDDDRDHITANKEELLGAIVEMEAQDETNSKTGPVASARNAVFMRLRTDREGIL